MKKLFTHFFMMLLTIFLLWSVLAWYFGEKNAQEFQQFLDSRLQQPGEKLLQAEILDYRKTLTGAEAQLRIISEYPLISERLGEFNIDAKLLNGPIFFRGKDVSIGTALWQFKLSDTDAIDIATEGVKELLGESTPTAVARIDFDNNLHYKISNSASDSSTEFDMVGFFNLDSRKNRGSVSIKDFKYVLNRYQLTSDSIEISYQLKEPLGASLIPGTSAIQIPRLVLKDLSGEQTPLIFLAKGNSDIQIKNNKIQGYLKVNFNQTPDVTGPDKTPPIKQAQMNLNIQQLDTSGILSYAETKADFDNIDQQIQWELEEHGEFPEGQDKIWQLQQQQKQLARQLENILANEIFVSDQKNTSNVRFELKTLHDSGDSILHGTIQPTTDNEAASPGLFSSLQAQAEVSLDEHMQSYLAQYLPIHKQRFQLIYRNNSLLMQ